MGEKNSNDMSSKSTLQIHPQNILHTPRKGLYQIYMGVKGSNDIPSEKNTPDLLPKIHVYPWGVSTKHVKE